MNRYDLLSKMWSRDITCDLQIREGLLIEGPLVRLAGHCPTSTTFSSVILWTLNFDLWNQGQAHTHTHKSPQSHHPVTPCDMHLSCREKSVLCKASYAITIGKLIRNDPNLWASFQYLSIITQVYSASHRWQNCEPCCEAFCAAQKLNIVVASRQIPPSGFAYDPASRLLRTVQQHQGRIWTLETIL